MKKLSAIALGLILISSIGCKQAKKEADQNTTETKEAEAPKEAKTELKTISFELEPKSDSQVSGQVTFTEENGTVRMVATLSGLSAGEHAIHIHEKADCTSPDGKSTGGHWNPTFQPHGKWGDAAGYHKGDIGNFVADAEGKGSVNFSTDEWCIGCGDDNKNIIGKAIIVHQGVDDFTSQPSGAAGARIACTGIIQ